VEELLWEEEKRRGRLLAAHGRDGPLCVLESPAVLPPRPSAGLPATPAVRSLIDRLLSRPVSASLLDAYLRCPRQFFQDRLARLTPAAEVSEGEDPLAVGRLLHDALQEYYAPLLGGELAAGASLTPQELQDARQELLAAFRAQPAYADLRQRLPADAFAMLNAAAEIHLSRYLETQPRTRPLALEVPLTADFPLPDRTLTLTGRADRLDLRRPPFSEAEEDPGGTCLYILDYKTGNPLIPAHSFWEDSRLWERFPAWEPGTAGDALLEEVAGRLKSIQLPFYLLLVSLARTQGRLPPSLASLPAPDSLDAAWISLGQGGKESSLFPAGSAHARRERVVRELIPALIRFLIRHLTENARFFPRPGPHCRWCFSGKFCTLR
jgi:hypothetical protein